MAVIVMQNLSEANVDGHWFVVFRNKVIIFFQKWNYFSYFTLTGASQLTMDRFISWGTVGRMLGIETFNIVTA